MGDPERIALAAAIDTCWPNCHEFVPKLLGSIPVGAQAGETRTLLELIQVHYIAAIVGDKSHLCIKEAILQCSRLLYI